MLISCVNPQKLIDYMGNKFYPVFYFFSLEKGCVYP